MSSCISGDRQRTVAPVDRARRLVEEVRELLSARQPLRRSRRGLLDQVQVDADIRRTGTRRAGSGRSSDRDREAERRQRVDHRIDGVRPDDQVEVVVVAGLPSDQRVDAPTAVDDRVGNSVEHGEDELRVEHRRDHLSARPLSPANTRGRFGTPSACAHLRRRVASRQPAGQCLADGHEHLVVRRVRRLPARRRSPARARLEACSREAQSSASASVPRTTSSCSFVSSRATATRRSGRTRRRGPRACAPSRWGASYRTMVRVSEASACQPLRAAASLAGQEAFEHEPAGRQTARHQRRDRGGWARYDLDRDSPAPSRPAPGVRRDRRCPVSRRPSPRRRARRVPAGRAPRRCASLRCGRSRPAAAPAARHRPARATCRSGGCPRSRSRRRVAMRRRRAAKGRPCCRSGSRRGPGRRLTDSSP